MSILGEILFWHWWVAGVLLLIVEMLVPGLIFLWFGLAAGLVGLTLLAFPEMTWQVQLLIFAALSVISLVAGRSFLRRRPIETDRPTLNRRGEQYVGRHFTLEEPVVNGLGKIKVDDSIWKIEGESDLPVGARVRVTAVDGTILTVEPT